MNGATASRSKRKTNTDALRKSEMMAHLLDALDAGRDIGHYGRLVFTMVARHFLDENALIAYLAKDKDFSEDAARSLVHQVASRGYNPPGRARILEWQAQQDFRIIANPDDPDAGNVYRDLTFPEGIYEDISEYHEQRAEASA